MNFKKLSREKKHQLVLVGLVTLTLMVGLGYGLIRFQLAYVASLAARKVDVDKKYKTMLNAIQSAEVLEAQVGTAGKDLAEQESGMVSGDKLSWLVTTIKTALRQHPKLDVPSYSQITEEDCTLLAKFPYPQVTIQINGTGAYHDIGRFLAEFENDHPHFRVLNLELEPAQAGGAGDKDMGERLAFKMNIVALVKPG